ncbi:MAG: hypothetical protein WC756_19105 [Taibaiella sp.]
MKKTEIVIVAISLIAIVLRLFSIEGGVLLSTLSFGILSLFYLFFGILLLNKIPIKGVFKKNAYSNLNWKRLLWSFVTGISLSIAIVGFLFKLNKWEGASMMLIVGIVILLLITAITLIRYIPKPSMFHSGVFIRSGIVTIASIILMIFR